MCYGDVVEKHAPTREPASITVAVLAIDAPVISRQLLYLLAAQSHGLNPISVLSTIRCLVSANYYLVLKLLTYHHKYNHS